VTRFIGIDLGTTFLKGAVLDLDRCVVGPARRVPAPDPVSGLPPTRHELDPAAVVSAVRRLSAELLDEALDAVGLVLCSQMHGLVLTDAHGNARSNAVTWKDQRGLEPAAHGPGSVADNLTRTLTEDEQHQTGRELRPGVPITTLRWFQDRGLLEPDTYPAALPDFVLANLCGCEPTTDPTNAAAHGLFDLSRNDWHRDLIARLGLDGLRWPRVRPFGELVGIADIAGRRVPCFTPVGDQQCALVGGGLGERELSLNIATGSQVSLLARDLPRGEFQVRPYFDGLWLRTLVQIPAGRSLAVLVELLTEISRAAGVDGPDPWAYIGRAVEIVPETDLDVDLAFFASLTGDRGRIANIRENNLTVGHLFAAAFRWMGRHYAQCAGVVSPGREWDRVVFSGGLAHAFPRLRREILDHLTHPPHRLSPTSEDTLRGLLTLAQVCAGRAKTVADAGRMVAEAEATPQNSPQMTQTSTQMKSRSD
jgi:sugar (pentulose or hexulose) kinase